MLKRPPLIVLVFLPPDFDWFCLRWFSWDLPKGLLGVVVYFVAASIQQIQAPSVSHSSANRSPRFGYLRGERIPPSTEAESTPGTSRNRKLSRGPFAGVRGVWSQEILGVFGRVLNRSSWTCWNSIFKKRKRRNMCFFHSAEPSQG